MIALVIVVIVNAAGNAAGRQGDVAHGQTEQRREIQIQDDLRRRLQEGQDARRGRLLRGHRGRRQVHRRHVRRQGGHQVQAHQRGRNRPEGRNRRPPRAQAQTHHPPVRRLRGVLLLLPRHGADARRRALRPHRLQVLLQREGGPRRLQDPLRGNRLLPLQEHRPPRPQAREPPPALRGQRLRHQDRRFRLRQKGPHAQLSDHAVRHARLRRPRDPRGGALRYQVRHVEPRGHHLHSIGGVSPLYRAQSEGALSQDSQGAVRVPRRVLGGGVQGRQGSHFESPDGQSVQAAHGRRGHEA
mmetsp:Transcript_2975/g.6439  ORF Transcript_2975/g.6439 Transcript_2975/m.6439 type:complete len:299 (-) Transcript_2975:94-990(-)